MKIKNWKKIGDSQQQQVWTNGKIRVVSAKGNQMWAVWYEKDIGKISSDDSFISHAYLGVTPIKEEAISLATKFMRSN